MSAIICHVQRVGSVCSNSELAVWAEKEREKAVEGSAYRASTGGNRFSGFYELLASSNWVKQTEKVRTYFQIKDANFKWFVNGAALIYMGPD